MRDIKLLEGEGIRLTPDEIVRLNCLALRMTRNPHAADIIVAPRVGWAGPVPIHQPTLQSEAWIDDYVSNWWTGDTAASALLYSCAHAVVPGHFARPELLTPVSAADAIRAWGKTLPCTEEQLKCALRYALTGNEPGVDVSPEPSDRPAAKAFLKSIEHLTPADLRAHAIDEAIAARLGIPLPDLLTLTHTRILSILRRSNRDSDGFENPDNTREQAAYARTLLAIKARHLASQQPNSLKA